MTFPSPPVKRKERIGLEPVLDFEWYPFKYKPGIILDFTPRWHVVLGELRQDPYDFLKHIRALKKQKKDWFTVTSTFHQ